MTFKPLPLLLKGLTPELENKAFLDLGETPQVKRDALEGLKSLIRKKPNFEPFMEDIFLLSFLRWKKFDVPKAFEALYSFYTLKEKYSRVYLNFKPSDLKHVLDMNQLTVQPLRDPDGGNVGILRIGYHDFKATTMDEIIATNMLMGLVMNDIEATQVSGAVLICDCKNLSFEIVQKLRLQQYYFVGKVLRCLPCRIKSVHMVNAPYFINILRTIMKGFFSKKIMERLFVHTNDFTELHKHVPPEILPEELGGTLGPIDNKEYINYFLHQQRYVEQINNGRIK